MDQAYWQEQRELETRKTQPNDGPRECWRVTINKHTITLGDIEAAEQRAQATGEDQIVTSRCGVAVLTVHKDLSTTPKLPAGWKGPLDERQKDMLARCRMVGETDEQYGIRMDELRQRAGWEAFQSLLRAMEERRSTR